MLWGSLAAASEESILLRSMDYERLKARAAIQRRQLEDFRLNAAKCALNLSG